MSWEALAAAIDADRRERDGEVERRTRARIAAWLRQSPAANMEVTTAHGAMSLPAAVELGLAEVVWPESFDCPLGPAKP